MSIWLYLKDGNVWKFAFDIAIQFSHKSHIFFFILFSTDVRFCWFFFVVVENQQKNWNLNFFEDNWMPQVMNFQVTVISQRLHKICIKMNNHFCETTKKNNKIFNEYFLVFCVAHFLYISGVVWHKGWHIFWFMYAHVRFFSFRYRQMMAQQQQQ
jgi:hypothetical protein